MQAFFLLAMHVDQELSVLAVTGSYLCCQVLLLRLQALRLADTQFDPSVPSTIEFIFLSLSLTNIQECRSNRSSYGRMPAYDYSAL